MSKIISVNISDSKGISKTPVVSGVLKEDHGLLGDVHAGEIGSKRQVSLLAIESIERMNSRGFDFKPGDFAENLTTSGLDLAALAQGTVLTIGKEVTVVVTQIGKKCHSGCAIFKQAGQCIMPKEGIFVRVVRGGMVKPGDEIMVKL